MTPERPTSAVRSYELVLTPDGDQIGAHVLRHGPAAPLEVAIGRPAAEAPVLAAAIFPLCPMAHRSAAELALEDAAGVQRQDRLRDAKVLAEAINTAVFRAAVTWAPLVGKDVHVHAVRQAREAVERLGLAGPAETARRLSAALEDTDDIWRAVMDGAESVQLRDDSHDRALAVRFARRQAHAQSLIDQLAQIEIGPTPAEVTRRDGKGQGSVQTARGTLTHTLTIRNAHIAAWQAEAPTDRNFAPGGPVEIAAAQLVPGPSLDHDARWLVAAFDPCVPCAVTVKEMADA